MKKSLHLFLRYLIPLLFIPLIIFIGVNILEEKQYIFISVMITILAIVFFVSGIEKKKIGSRRMVIISIMIALSVVGRFIPFFQPIASITIITAIHLGAESGFLVGSLSAFVSNFYFGQGPWTPFQMLAWGLIGILASSISNHLIKHKYLLLIFGVITGIIYSFIMDIWTVMWFSNGLSLSLYVSAIITALPHTIMYSISNFLFLFICGEAFGKKLRRVKLLYGI
jgi:energy-coupling factor transport system substrate-specific component